VIYFKTPGRRPQSLNCGDLAVALLLYPLLSLVTFSATFLPIMQSSQSEKQDTGIKVLEHEPRLPTYEEATGQFDCSKLPSYSIKRRARFHPYSRYFPIAVDETDRLFVRSPTQFFFSQTLSFNSFLFA